MRHRNKNKVPLLSESQIELLSKFGDKMSFTETTILIEEGQKNFSLYVVLKGEIEIRDPFDPDHLIAVHKKGSFTGDTDMLSDRAAVFIAVALKGAEVLHIRQEKLKEILFEDAALNNLLISAFILRREKLLKNEGGYIIVGSKYSAKSFELRDFFTKNHLRHHWLNVEKDKKAREIFCNFNIAEKDLPVLITSHFEILRNVTILEAASLLGVSSFIQDKVYQVMVVGAGPAGLAASVYGASEGLDTITIDRLGPGGQAGTTSKIENYLGFPRGISGSDLANNAYLQAQKFGCTISIPCEGKKLSVKDKYFELLLNNGSVIKAKTVIAATGAKYRNLAIPNIDFYKGRGLYYSATAMEASLTKKSDIVVIVGGGNSAGQAAIYLADYVKKIHLVIRSSDLEKSMSSYLVNRIKNNAKITIHGNTEITNLQGNRTLERVSFKNNSTREIKCMNIDHLFLFLGAVPVNEWLPTGHMSGH